MRRLTSRLALSVFSAFLLVLSRPSLALACAVCFSAKNDASRQAFIITTAGLTLLPLLFIAWGVRWVIRRERERDALEAAQLLAAQGDKKPSDHQEVPS